MPALQDFNDSAPQPYAPPQVGALGGLGQGNSALQTMVQNLQQQLTQGAQRVQDAQAARTTALQAYQDAVRTAGVKSPADAFFEGWTNPADPYHPESRGQTASAFASQARQDAEQRKIMAAQLGYANADKDVTTAAQLMQHTQLSPSALLGLERSNMVTDRVAFQQYDQLYRTLLAQYIKDGDPNPEEKAHAAATAMINNSPLRAATQGMPSPTPATLGGQQQQPQVNPQIAYLAAALRKARAEGDVVKEASIARATQALSPKGDFGMVQTPGGRTAVGTTQDVEQATGFDGTPPAAPAPAAPVVPGTNLAMNVPAKASMTATIEDAKKLADTRSKYRDSIIASSAPARDLSNILNEVENSVGNLQGTRLEPDKFAPFKSQMLQFLHAAGWSLTPQDETAIANATDVQKLNSMLSSLSTKQVSSRPGVFEFATFLKNNPSLDMTPESLKKLIGFMRHTANTTMQIPQDYAQWAKDDPHGDPLTFDAYYNSVRSNPDYWEYLRSKGLPSSYAEISAAARQRGIAPSKMLDYIVNQAKKMQRR